MEDLESAAIKQGVIWVFKKVFGNKRAMTFYKKTWEAIQFAFIALMAFVMLFIVSKSKMPVASKIGALITIVLGMALLTYLVTAKVQKIESVKK